MKYLRVIFISSLFLIITIFYILNTASGSKEQVQFSLDESYYLDISKPEEKIRTGINPNKNAYFGDLHVHTSNSFDAYTFGTISSPESAYRYAQGESILHPTGYDIQLRRPLDFYAVTDHGIFLGLLPQAADTSSLFSRYKISKPIHNLNESVSGNFLDILKRNGLFRTFGQEIADGLQNGTIDIELVNEIQDSVWQETIRAADEAYKPGVFTTFAGYEYTSTEELYKNYLHRNVIFKDTKNLPTRIFSRLDSLNPELLWEWMNNLRSGGVDSLAIPHNSNISGGAAFPVNDFNGGPMTNMYSINRLLNEPIVEITQVKGTSETHPLLSKNDEWASFETDSGMIESNDINNLRGGFVRDAYLRGLTLDSNGISNPYKFGLIGSSDTHVGGASYNEKTYFSKIGLLDGSPKLRGSVPFNKLYGFTLSKFVPDIVTKVNDEFYFSASDRLIYFGASGLAGVWAEENTRESIFNAFKRKETFATSGPRIKVRFFGGYGLDKLKIDDINLIKKVSSASTPMGGDIQSNGATSPTFLIWAVADPYSGLLQRSQIIKGWIEDGEQNEKVYDVACSDGLDVDPINNRCPDNGFKVNLDDCSTTSNVGDSELKVFWKDPDFKENQSAFYYVRVLENPSCRWSTWDSIRAGKKPRLDVESTIQERAWSSPIWIKSLE